MVNKLENLELIMEKFKTDNFAQNLGIVLDELTETKVKMHMLLKPEMNNFHKRPHGAAIYSLADAAFSVIGNSRNNICVALNCTINYHSSPNPNQTLYVEGNPIKQTRKIGTYNFELYTEEDGVRNKVATMISTLYCTGKPHDSNLDIK